MTLRLMAALCRARLLIAFVPFRRWKSALGGDGRPAIKTNSDLLVGERLARQVEGAAKRLPLETKCLPRAMVLSWMLRRRDIPHAIVFAVRPQQQRKSADTLHAWVEVAGLKVIGDLPGEWIETLRLGE